MKCCEGHYNDEVADNTAYEVVSNHMYIWTSYIRMSTSDGNLDHNTVLVKKDNNHDGMIS